MQKIMQSRAKFYLLDETRGKGIGKLMQQCFRSTKDNGIILQKKIGYKRLAVSMCMKYGFEKIK